MKARNWILRTKQRVIEEMLGKLDQTQRVLVEECIAAAKVPSRRRRYNIQWVYECLLMRVRSKSLYNHLRDNNLLPLPHVDTLHAYIKRMGSAYGFNESTFKLLEEKWKSGEIDSSKFRGSLLIDEIKISEAVRFNKDSGQFDGFVNVGPYKAPKKKKKKSDKHSHIEDVGNHALVFMLQSFKGQWVQTLGAFLTAVHL